MPSSPKIPKEKILHAALNFVIREGYPSLNIKALAKELGSSTQPISWHFGNMEGLRRALTEYALAYANEKLLNQPQTNGMKSFLNIGIGYINLAFDEPNLFQYLFMNSGSGYHAGGMDALVNADENSKIIDQIATHLNINKDQAGIFLRNTIIYTHGIASLIAAGILVSSKSEVLDLMKEAAYSFLLRTGANLDTLGLSKNNN